MSVLIFGAAGADGKALSRPLLRVALGRAGWDQGAEIRLSPRGKPLFARPDRWLSLSHSGRYALCALAEEPVGVDIEVVRPHRPGLPQYSLSPGELEEWDGSWEDFCRLWTLKESWCKREDTPLYPPRKVPVPPPCPHRSYEGAGWRAAVCCHGRPPEEILWLPPEELAAGVQGGRGTLRKD